MVLEKKWKKITIDMQNVFYADGADQIETT